MAVSVSVPGSSTLQNYNFTTTGTTAATFVTDWTATGIPNTTAVVTDSGAVQLTHTLGGEIYLNDRNPTNNTSVGLLDDLGFIPNITEGVKKGINTIFTLASVSQTSTNGSGTGGSFNITVSGLNYVANAAAGGTGYARGDLVTIAGTHFGGVSPDNDMQLTVTKIIYPGDVTVDYVRAGLRSMTAQVIKQ